MSGSLGIAPPNLPIAQSLSTADIVIVDQLLSTNQRQTGQTTLGALSNAISVTATNATTSRPLSSLFADVLNVKNFGAKLDGVSDDSQAFQAALTAARPGQTIYVPYGGLVLNTTPTNSPGVTWKVDGTHFGTGASVVNYITPNDQVDWVTGGPGGRMATWRTVTNSAYSYATRSVETFHNTSGGTIGNVAHSFIASTTVGNSAVNDYCWALQGQVLVNGTGAGQHVGVAGIGWRQTANTTAGNGVWAFYGQASDKTGLRQSLAGPITCAEFDLFANDVDDGGTVGGVAWGSRVLLQLTYAKAITTSPAAQVAHGILLGNSDTSQGSLGSGFRLVGAFYQSAVDTRLATQNTGANAIWLNDGHTVAWDKAGSYTMWQAQGTFNYANAGTNLLAIAPTGQTALGGTTWLPGIGLKIGNMSNMSVAISTVDASNATIGLRMATGQKLSLNSTDFVTVGYNATSGRLTFYYGATAIVSFDSSGAIRSLGPQTGNTTP